MTKTKLWALFVALLAGLVAGTLWLQGHTSSEPEIIAPSPSAVAYAAEPLETAQQAFARAMRNCEIGQGHGAALSPADGASPAALTARIPRVLDAAGLTTDQLGCLVFQLGGAPHVPDMSRARSGQAGWTPGEGEHLTLTWDRDISGLFVVITGPGLASPESAA